MSNLSSSWSVGSWSSDGEVRSSPIRYRRGPLDYEPAVLCHCRKKAALWISWSNGNPGRRYLKCFNARNGGCDFHGWYEGPVDVFIRDLLVDLRDAVWSLKKEKLELKAALAETVMKLEVAKQEAGKMLEAKDGEIAGIREMLRKVEKQRHWMFALCVFFVASVAMFMRLC